MQLDRQPILNVVRHQRRNADAKIDVKPVTQLLRSASAI